MIKTLKREGYTDLCIKLIKTRKQVELSRKNYGKKWQVLTLDLQDLEWLIKMLSVLDVKKYEPLNTYYGVLEISLGEQMIGDFVTISNNEAKQKVLIGFNEFGWILTQLRKIVNEERKK